MHVHNPFLLLHLYICLHIIIISHFCHLRTATYFKPATKKNNE